MSYLSSERTISSSGIILFWRRRSTSRVECRKRSGEGRRLFNVQSMDLLSVISENLIRSITLQVDVEKLTHELVLRYITSS